MSRILIVEDDVVLARALKNWLERVRLQVTCAITAANARRIIANEEVDIILSDLRLPDGDGIELLEWMKKNKCRIPLIIMTQHAEVSSAIRAMKAGAEDYLSKPIHPETLYPKLNDVLLRTRKTKLKQTGILQRVSPQIREVERRASSDTVYAVDATSETSDFIKGLVQYSLEDEWIVYELCEERKSGIAFSELFRSDDWEIYEQHILSSDIICRIYHRKAI